MTARPAGAAPDGYLLALDAGTGGCRAALFTADGRPAALARRDWSHPADAGIPGSQSFDMAGNWALICACIREVTRRRAQASGGPGCRLLQHGRRAGALRPGRA